MKYTVDYLLGKNIVCVIMKGRLNFKTAEQYSKEAVKLARQNECTKFFIDHTKTTVQGGVNKIHTAGEELQQFGFRKTDRIAVVLANFDNDPNLLEPVNQNSRWSVVKYFCEDNIEEVFDWLLETK